MLTKNLDDYQKNGLMRTREILASDQTTNLINFASNDYLQIAQDTKVKKAFASGVSEYGLGSTGSPLVSGFHRPQALLEAKFAEFLNRDKAILFNSGYHANLGVITTLTAMNKKMRIVTDKHSHASIIDGILLSKARYQRYGHNNLTQLEALLRETPSCLLSTESIFSMEGNISPVDKIAQLAARYQANLMIDDAHGIGVLGQQGGGITEYYRLTQKDIPYLTVPLGKALGSMGAIVSGDSIFIESLIQFARTYIYSTALPPAIACATLTCLNIIQTEYWRREKLHHLILFFIAQSAACGLQLISSDITPIKAILIGNNTHALSIQSLLKQKGFLVACIRPPSVPKNTARIKICLNIHHTENNIRELLSLLADLKEKIEKHAPI